MYIATLCAAATDSCIAACSACGWQLALPACDLMRLRLLADSTPLLTLPRARAQVATSLAAAASTVLESKKDGFTDLADPMQGAAEAWALSQALATMLHARAGSVCGAGGRVAVEGGYWGGGGGWGANGVRCAPCVALLRAPCRPSWPLPSRMHPHAGPATDGNVHPLQSAPSGTHSCCHEASALCAGGCRPGQR